MVVEEMDELLKPYQCFVSCESPFEIASDCGEFVATGFFAEWVLDHLIELDRKPNAES